MSDDKSTEKKQAKKTGPSAWPSPGEAASMVMKLAKDIKKSGAEIYGDYKEKRNANDGDKKADKAED